MTETDAKRIKPVVDELAPKLNAYLRSIGKKSDATDNGPLTTDK